MDTLAGFLVGVIVGITGVGGGSLMTPLLIFLFGVAPTQAIGTDLLYAALTKTGGTLFQHKHNLVRWDIVLKLGIPSCSTSLVTLSLFPSMQVSWLKTLLGITLLLTAGAILFRHKLRFNSEDKPTWLISLAGALIGFLVTTTSIGAGALGTVVLFYLWPKEEPIKLIATDIAHAIPLTLIAGTGHFIQGNVQLPLLISLLAGSIPGIWLGTKFARKIPENWLRISLATLLSIISLKLLFSN